MHVLLIRTLSRKGTRRSTCRDQKLWISPKSLLESFRFDPVQAVEDDVEEDEEAHDDEPEIALMFSVTLSKILNRGGAKVGTRHVQHSK